MAESTELDYRDLLLSFARGDTPKLTLPLDDPRFWESTVVRAARSGRSSARTPNLGIAAERILFGPLAETLQAAKVSGAIAALSSPDTRVRRIAIHVLRDCTSSKQLIEAASGAVHDRDSEVRLTALMVLSEKATLANLPNLLEILERTNDIRATIASEAIVRAGEEAIPGLEKFLDSSDSRVRWRAALCLSRMETKAAETSLLRAFHDDSPDVAWVAADGLLRLGPSVAVDVLRSIMNSPFSGVTVRALHHYAEHASPLSIFGPIEMATTGSAAGVATLTAIDNALSQLGKTA